MAISRPSAWVSSDPVVRNVPTSVRISGVDTSSIPDMRFNGSDLTKEALRRNVLKHNHLLNGVYTESPKPKPIIDISTHVNTIKKIPWNSYKKKFIEVMKK